MHALKETNPVPVPAPDHEAIKVRQRATWSTGDYGRIGVTLQIVGEELCEAAGVSAADRVLDVAAGNGNASLAALRRFAEVTSTDYVPELLEQGRRRAEADCLSLHTQVADAEALPFDDGSFDAVVAVSSFEFISDFDRACAEIVRVLRPDGSFFVVTPGDSPFLDLGLKILTGADAERDYQGKRKLVMPALLRHFRVAEERRAPTSLFCIYRGFRLVPRAGR